MQVKRSDSRYSSDTVSVLSADDQITALNSKVCTILVTVTADNICIDPVDRSSGGNKKRGATSVPNGKGIHDSDLLNLYIRVT